MSRSPVRLASTRAARRDALLAGERRSSDCTEADFLNAAERLFAEHGFEGAKIRAIAEAAGTNLGALHYYWGSKEALLRAVCDRRLRPVVNERLRRFDLCVANAKGGRPDVKAVLEAAILPTFEAAGARDAETKLVGALLARLFTDPSEEVKRVIAGILDEASVRYIQLLRAACTHLDDETFYWRVHAVIGASQFAYSSRERVRHLSRNKFRGTDAEAGAAELIKFLMAGLMAGSGARAAGARQAKAKPRKRPA